jgi:enamine deaminase RidA (YjgF/YER057c/UK114 family)
MTASRTSYTQKEIETSTMNITRKDSQHSQVVTLDRGEAQETFLSARRRSPGEMSIFDNLPSASGTIVGQLVFGGCGFHKAARAHMADAGGPLLWVQGDVCPGTQISGMQAFAIQGGPVLPVKLADQVVGSFWSDEDADYCLLAGILPSSSADERGMQTQSSFEQMEAALHQVGMDFSHVVRTWFFLEDLLAWYDEFNAARTSFFRNRGVFERLIPASTGIGASNPSGSALASGALAVRPKHAGVRIAEVASPLQCEATEYRSSFSRAVEVVYPDRRLLLISGTASIAPGGASMFPEDVEKQIHLTLDVVEAILKSRGMGWQNTIRAVGYFRNIDDLAVFEACCEKRGIAPLPLAPAHATVCRADLLFEMELDAIAAVKNQESGVESDVVRQER